MSAIRVAVAVFGAAVTISRHPVVRAGARAVRDNPQLQDLAITTTRKAAYGAGVVARHLTSLRLR